MKIESIKPGHHLFNKVSDAIKGQIKSNRIDYDAIAREYNDLPKRGILLIDVSQKTSLGNFANVLEGRGVVRNIDYAIVRMKETSDGERIPIQKRPIAIERKTDTDMLTLQP